MNRPAFRRWTPRPSPVRSSRRPVFQAMPYPTSVHTAAMMCTSSTDQGHENISFAAISTAPSPPRIWRDTSMMTTFARSTPKQPSMILRCTSGRRRTAIPYARKGSTTALRPRDTQERISSVVKGDASETRVGQWSGGVLSIRVPLGRLPRFDGPSQWSLEGRSSGPETRELRSRARIPGVDAPRRRAETRPCPSRWLLELQSGRDASEWIGLASESGTGAGQCSETTDRDRAADTVSLFRTLESPLVEIRDVSLLVAIVALFAPDAGLSASDLHQPSSPQRGHVRFGIAGESTETNTQPIAANAIVPSTTHGIHDHDATTNTTPATIAPSQNTGSAHHQNPGGPGPSSVEREEFAGRELGLGLSTFARSATAGPSYLGGGSRPSRCGAATSR